MGGSSGMGEVCFLCLVGSLDGDCELLLPGSVVLVKEGRTHGMDG